MKIPKIIFFSIACLLISHDNVYGGSNNSGQSASVNDLISPNPNSGNLGNAPTAKVKKHHHKNQMAQNAEVDQSAQSQQFLPTDINSSPAGSGSGSGSGKSKKNSQGTNIGASSGSHSGKSGKIHMLEQQVAKLQGDVKSLKQAVAALQSSAS